MVAAPPRVIPLRDMLGQRIPDRPDPSYGTNGFPYPCGVNPDEFDRWARSALDDLPEPPKFVVSLLKMFCESCDAGFRRDAMNNARCVGPVISRYHAPRSGRPRKHPLTESAAR
jgi:hypothetical protein